MKLCKGQDSISFQQRKPNLWGYLCRILNSEDFTPENLKLLKKSRAHAHPSVFAHADFDATIIGRIQEVIKVGPVPEKVMILDDRAHGHEGADIYERIVS